MTSAGADHLNSLFYGDNLTLMKKELKDNSVDLIYLDPPFNSKRNYNIMYKNMTGREVPEQVEAFCDTWTMDAEKQDLLDNMLKTMRLYKMDGDFAELWTRWMSALRKTRRDLTAYLLYMTVRLLEMRRVLKDTGSIYLHCDPHASHYIKVMMDGMFGHKNFRNELIWHYTNKLRDGRKRVWQSATDIILFYTKSDKYFFQTPYMKREKPVKYARMKKVDGKKINVRGKDGKVEYMETDKKIMDNVLSIPMLTNQKERLGYPTQKPKKLLEQIIQASCPKEGTVLDPFCGCGTTLYATQELNMQKEHNRTWIGMDIAILSTRLVKDQLETKYELTEGQDFAISGTPVSAEQAKDLWERDPFQFQNWAVEYVEGFCTNRKTRDGGVDGRIYFKAKEQGKGEWKSMIISVKGGKLKPSDVRDLVGTMKQEEAVLGGLISFAEPTKDMKNIQADMGYLRQDGTNYLKLQFLTVKQMLEDKRLFHVPNIPNRKDTRKNPQNAINYATHNP